MKKKFEKVYQFKISLKGVEPPIWRRIQVPGTYTFWDLHVAIQNAMGWQNYHLHEFDIKDPHKEPPNSRANVKIGLPNEDYPEDFIPDWELNISDFFKDENRVAYYIYDFGDGWVHIIELEAILESVEGINYPRCIDGKRACPPEDCGGIGGYADFLRAILNPEHKQHKEIMEWIGRKFDPEYFDVKDVKFEDPGKLLRNLHRKF
jgi:hypothetical protein